MPIGKLTKSEQKEFATLLEAARTEADDFQALLSDVKTFETPEDIGRFKATLPVDALMDVFEALESWCEGLCDTQSDLIDNCSERWQESEKGEATMAWLDEWQSREMPDRPDLDTLSVIGFHGFPDEVSPEDYLDVSGFTAYIEHLDGLSLQVEV
jgi:hypothetical protein